jgi:integrase
LKKYITSKIGSVKFTTLTRTDIAGLLKDIKARHRASTAEKCRGVLRRIFRWYDEQHDWPSPIANLPKIYEYQPRSRLITDEELASIWQACENHRFGPILKLLFLTGQRLDKIQSLWWDDVVDGVWTVRTSKREKGNIGRVKLPKMAQDIIDARPRHAHNARVFRDINVFVAVRVIQRMSGTAGWTAHDARRWAKSAMQK